MERLDDIAQETGGAVEPLSAISEESNKTMLVVPLVGRYALESETEGGLAIAREMATDLIENTSLGSQRIRVVLSDPRVTQSPDPQQELLTFSVSMSPLRDFGHEPKIARKHLDPRLRHRVPLDIVRIANIHPSDVAEEQLTAIVEELMGMGRALVDLTKRVGPPEVFRSPKRRPS